MNYQTGSKSASAVLAGQDPPRILSNFDFQLVSENADIDICVRFRLACKSCRSNHLVVLCYREPLDEPIDGEEFLETCPHRIHCKSCNKTDLLFDSNKHGYDGELSHNTLEWEHIGDEIPIECGQHNYQVEVIFTYNSDLEELQEIASEKKLRPQDLFDWFHVIAISDEGVELKDINYECA